MHTHSPKKKIKQSFLKTRENQQYLLQKNIIQVLKKMFTKNEERKIGTAKT